MQQPMSVDNVTPGEGVDREREPEPPPVVVRPRRRQRRSGVPRDHSHSAQEELGFANPEPEVM